MTKKRLIFLAGILLFLTIGLPLIYWRYTILDASFGGFFIDKVFLLFTPTTKASTVNQAVNNNKNPIIVDVRPREEFDKGHIPGADMIPLSTLGEEVPKLYAKKDRLVYVYGKTGDKGGVAARLLRVIGYKYSFNIEDGLNGWEKAGYSIEK